MYTHTHTMDIVLLETLARCKVDVATNFVDFNEPLGLATFLDLFL